MLRELFPHGCFALPAGEARIEAVETELSVRLPEQLRQLYLICDGFREDRGNAKYLFALTDEDTVGSLLTVTQYHWTQVAEPNLRSFIFFGSSSADEQWGLNWKRPNEVIAYHYHIGRKYEIVGEDILHVYRADYAKYEELRDGVA